MREFELEAYRKLCEALDIPILAAECSDGAHWNAAEFIRRNACDIMRTSTHYKGGFTGGIRVAHTAEAFGMNAEVHGGGHANLHLCLAIPNCTYYEDLVIDPIDIESRKRGPLVFKDGNFGFPEGLVGLGLEFDLEDLKKSCLSSITVK
jgi:L-alanine-DL-glutamate epimerase-like enolase superfamily enzyme